MRRKKTCAHLDDDASAPQNVSARQNAGVVEIKEKMFIAQTNDVYLNADEYLGKTLRLEGLLKHETYNYDDGADVERCYVLRYAPGCCGYDGNAGFEVAWQGGAAEYPAEDAWVLAEGVLSS